MDEDLKIVDVVKTSVLPISDWYIVYATSATPGGPQPTAPFGVVRIIAASFVSRTTRADRSQFPDADVLFGEAFTANFDGYIDGSVDTPSLVGYCHKDDLGYLPGGYEDWSGRDAPWQSRLDEVRRRIAEQNR